MDNTKLLKQIGEVIDDKLEPIKVGLKEVKSRLTSLEEKVTSLEEKVENVRERVTTLELKVEVVNKRIGQAQEETIDALTAVMGHAYDMHEKRFKRIEDHLHLPPQH